MMNRLRTMLRAGLAAFARLRLRLVFGPDDQSLSAQWVAETFPPGGAPSEYEYFTERQGLGMIVKDTRATATDAFWKMIEERQRTPALRITITANVTPFCDSLKEFRRRVSSVKG